MIFRRGDLSGGQFAADPRGEFFHIRAAQRSDGNFLVCAVNGHRLQCRFLGQRLKQRARKTALVRAGAGSSSGVSLGHRSE